MNVAMFAALNGSAKHTGTKMQRAIFGFLPDANSFYLDGIVIEGAGEYQYMLNDRKVTVTLEDDFSGSISVPSADAGTKLIVRGEVITEISQDDSQVLTSLDVTGLTALTSLKCDYNALTSLDVTGLTALTYLDCSHNALTSLDVTGLTALTYLDCGYNALTSLDVTGCLSINNFSPNADLAQEEGSTLTISGAATNYAAIKSGMEAKGWTVVTA